MNVKDEEIEVKFYVQDLGTIENRLQELGAERVQSRTHEYNLRFDTPDDVLTQSDQLLRLRRDSASHMTYKGPGITLDGVYHRKEIQFTLSDFDAAQAFLEALGYHVTIIYEKFRSEYSLGDVMVTLDELPIGDFIEIEGPDSVSIKETSCMLGLRWTTRITGNYLSLFQNACQAMEIKPNNLTFKDLANTVVLPVHLGVHPADGSSDDQ
jgi:adenylate cyclase class 2